jgi:hypothetical protein
MLRDAAPEGATLRIDDLVHEVQQMVAHFPGISSPPPEAALGVIVVPVTRLVSMNQVPGLCGTMAFEELLPGTKEIVGAHRVKLT